MGRVNQFFTVRGAALLEAMLAVAIGGMGLVGFAIALQKCIEASTFSYHELRLREALESRLTEIKAEQVQNGSQTYHYFQNEVIVEQNVKPAEFHNYRNAVLSGLRDVTLSARYATSESKPLQTEALVYQP